jgi:hypothetical protein
MKTARLDRLAINYSFGFGSLLFATALSSCSGSPGSYSPSMPVSSPAAASRPVAGDAVRAWSRSLIRVPLPSAGCFKASYPAIGWSRVACAKAAPPPPIPPPSGNVTPAVIGDGRDLALSVSPQIISTAIGSFPDVSGVKHVRTVGVRAFGKGCVCGNDAYTLQLNSNTYLTNDCGRNPQCTGWEQFVYASPTNTSVKTAEVFIQDWRIRTTSTSLKCPPKHSGWAANGGDCYYSSPGIEVPAIPISELDEMSLSGSAASSGDSAFLTVGTTAYGMKNVQGDLMDLDRNWTGAEFNIVGDCCGSRASFNAGSKITVSIEADDGSTAAPACLTNKGTTAETNSLSFVAAPSNAPEQQYPSILFTEAGKADGSAPSCDTLAGL